MVVLEEREKDVVRNALLSLKGSITKRHLSHVSKLPGNGKSKLTASDEEAEQSVINQLKSIDTVLSRYATADDNNDDKALHAGLQYNPFQIEISAESSPKDEEPFINPFTGRWVYPENPNAPSSSAVRAGPTECENHTSETMDSTSFDQAYRDAIYTTAASNKIPDRGSKNTTSLSMSKNPFRNAPRTKPACGVPDPFESFVEPLSTKSNTRSLESYLQSFEDSFDREVQSLSASETSNSSDFIIDTPYTSNTNLSVIDQEYASPIKNTDNLILEPRRHETALDMRTNEKTQDLNHKSEVQKINPRVQISRKVQKVDIRQPEQYKEDHELAIAMQEESILNEERLDNSMKLAMSLAGDSPQDPVNFLQVQESFTLLQQQELQTIQDNVHRKDEEDYASRLAELQRMESEWNREWEESLRRQQIMAQQIAENEEQKIVVATLKEMRRLQDMLQSEENQQIEADRQYALSLSLSEEQYVEEPPPYQTQASAATSHNQTSTATPPLLSLMPAQSSLLAQIPVARTISVHRMSLPGAFPDDPGRDQTILHTEHPDKSFRQAQRMQDQWQSEWEAEIEQNAQAAQALQQEIRALEIQARRDLEHAQKEHERQRQEHERRRQETARRQKEAEMARAEAERQRKAREVECNVCGESADRDTMYHFPCKHAYCRECLNQSIEHAVSNKKAFQCCKRRIDPSRAPQFLSPDLCTRYTNLVQELDTPDPTYCSNRSCSAFIPPNQIKASTALCTRCSTQTCSKCKNITHAGICSQDKEGQALLKLSGDKKWKKCPHCSQMIERKSGCLHMTCVCGRDFCYNCGKPSSQCSGTCKR